MLKRRPRKKSAEEPMSPALKPIEKVHLKGVNESILVRNATHADIPSITKLCEEVYPDTKPWNQAQLSRHLELFPEGQLVAQRIIDGEIIGYAASLIITWRDILPFASWKSVTNAGYFATHDPKNGKTLYGAEVIVSPKVRGKGVGGLLYRGRRQIVKNLGLLRIRAGARLQGYHRYARNLSAQQYLDKVISGEIIDATLTFQLKKGFRALHLIPRYIEGDPESLGFAALIEWTPGVRQKKETPNAR